MKVIDLIEINEKFEDELKNNTPWLVKRSQLDISLFGTQISFGNGDGDFIDLNEAREALEFVIDQLGGKITWRKNDSKKK